MAVKKGLCREKCSNICKRQRMRSETARNCARSPRPVEAGHCDFHRRSRRVLAGELPAGAADVRVRRLAKFQQNVARFRLYRLRFLQENMRFAAFFKIYQIIKLNFLNLAAFCNFCEICKIFAKFSRKLLIFQTDFLRNF